MKKTNLARFIAQPSSGRKKTESQFAGGSLGATGADDPNQRPTGVRRRGGFSLIEMIGVLAIVAILAATLVPVIANEIQSSEVTTESSNMVTLQGALTAEIEHNFEIPGSNDWFSAVASWLMVPSHSITNNSAGYNRVYLYDLNGFGGVSLPYFQNYGLANLPSNPRLLIVSCLNANVPDASGGIGTNEFTAIWNTPPGGIPSTWTTNSFHGNGSTLVIQRINLMPLFKQIILSPVDTNDFGGVVVQSGQSPSPYILVLTNGVNETPILPIYSMVGGVIALTNNNLAFPSGGGTSTAQTFSAWYLLGTVFKFYDTNNSPTVPYLESQLVVQDNNSLVFEDQAWRGLLTGWGTNGPAGLSTSVGVGGTAAAVATAQNCTWTEKNFKGCGHNPNDWQGDSRGDSCTAMAGCFHSYMMDYNNWCDEGFGTGSDNSCGRLSQDATRIYNITQNMCQ